MIKKKKFGKLFQFFQFSLLIFYEIFCYENHTDFDYPMKKRLNNGKYLVMTGRGIYLFNDEFNSKENITVFDSYLINENKEIYSSDIAQFLSEDNGYILCLLLYNLYIISKVGVLLTNFTVDFVEKERGNQIIPLGHSGNSYYFTIINVNNDKNIYFRKYEYNKLNNNVQFVDIFFYWLGFTPKEYISCELMIYLNEKVIFCLYGNWDNAYYTVFNITNFSPINNYSGKINGIDGGQRFISDINSITKKTVGGCKQKKTDLTCFGYNIETNEFTTIKILSENECKEDFAVIKVEFFPETEEFLMVCKKDKKTGDLNDYYISRLKDNIFSDTILVENAVPYKDGSPCPQTNLFNIIYSSGKYSILTDSPFCQDDRLVTINDIEVTQIREYPADCDGYITFDNSQCYSYIPDGYFYNDSSQNIIYRCHSNCKKCYKEGTDDNNNCIKCPEIGKKYLDFGNCVSDCSERGGYFEEPNDNSILRCKCPNTKCLYCTSESLEIANNLCISCNKEAFYYPKINDNTNEGEYINCYNNLTISDGYYLNNEREQYEECYSSCKKCKVLGSEDNNKCDECIVNNELIENNNNIKNCYEICEYYYYFDKDDNYKYKCTDYNNCPSGYKLINSTKKCIDNCNNDNIYNCKYEYKSICYDKLICEFYYDYNHTSCLTQIPEGYYCNSTSDKTIDKCHENCKVCKDNKNNCLTCKEGKYYDLGNCKDNCEHGSFHDTDSILKCKCTKNISCLYCTEESNELNLCVSCNNEEGYYQKIDDEIRDNGFVNCYKNPEGYYLDSDIYKSCYSTCKNCTENGTELDNKCTECIEGYEFKHDFPDDNNCYKTCDFYYYYDSNNEYKCTNESSCPINLSKLIIGKNRCVDNCMNYNLLEYKNECISNCPDGMHNKNNICLDCENEGKYYNYNQTACIDNITIGYYCNDTLLKTIDKCQDNCKTCEQKGDDENNNCSSCPDSFFFDLGNCKNSCINGDFMDGTIKKCKCSTNITCKFCSEESNLYNLCVSCNIEKGYYPKINDSNNIGLFINCYNEDTISEGYYLNSIEKQYESCYENCKKCNELGDENNNKCLECKKGYDFKNDFQSDKNCYENCKYSYYFNNSKYYCTKDDNCPKEYNLFIKDKKRCINNCSLDNEYIYLYNNNCYKQCPRNTTKSKTNEFLCEPCVGGICSNLNNIIDGLIVNYQVENTSCDNDYIEEIEKDKYNIYIFKNINCTEVPPSIPVFGECYNIIKENNNINEEDELIVTKVKSKQYQISGYSFYNPYTLEELDSAPCKNEKVEVHEDITKKIVELEDSKEKLILDLIKQGINVFNVSDPFYTDICYHYISPNGKDVPLKARLIAFFPNITLCDDGCENVGVDIETMRAKCECKFINLVNIDIISDTLYGQAIKEIFDIISEVNLAVIKCFKDIFNIHYFAKNTGGIIILSLFAGQIICIIKFAVDGLYPIRKYIFDLTQSYIKYIGKNIIITNVQFPPKKKKKIKKIINNPSQNKSKRGLLLNNISSNKKFGDSSKKNIVNIQKSLLLNNKKTIKITNLETTKKRNSLIFKNESNKFNTQIKKTNNIQESKINMKEYLSVSFDEEDFDDVIEKEKRTFCTYFLIKFQKNQIFIYTFYIREPLRPRIFKIIILIMTIELYFVINALFYNEDYLSELFYSKEKDKFYSFIFRRFNHFIYTSAVSSIISYCVGYVFVDDDKIKKIFRKNKEGDIKMKYKLSILVKDIKNKFRFLIILSLFITIICFIYISCFNNVYPYIKKEWINSSLFILIFMQIINFLFTLIECILRYSAIKCNNEKLFKLSNVFGL